MTSNPGRKTGNVIGNSVEVYASPQSDVEQNISGIQWLLFSDQNFSYLLGSGDKMTNSFVKEGEVEYVDEITMRSSVSASSSKTSPFMKSMPSPVFHYEYPAVQFECMDAQLGYLSNPLRHENAFHDAHLEYVDPSQACYLDTKHFVSRSLASSAIEEPYVEVTEDSGTDSITAPPQMVMSKSMMELDDLLSKLNPMAEEFTPPSQSGKSNSTGESETELSESDSRKVKPPLLFELSLC